MKRFGIKVMMAAIAYFTACLAYAAWSITNPPAQTPPYSILYNKIMDCNGASEILAGQIQVKAGASAEQDYEIDTTLMTDANGDWTGSIGDGQWDFLGQHGMAIYEVDVVPAKATREFEVVE